MTKPAAETIAEIHYAHGAVIGGAMADALHSIATVFPGAESWWWRNGPGEKWESKPQPHGAQRAREIAASITGDKR